MNKKKNKKYLFGSIEIKNAELLRTELDRSGLKIVGIQRSFRAKKESLGKLSVEKYIDSILKNDGRVEFKLALIDKWCIRSGMAKIEAVCYDAKEENEIIKIMELKKVTISK